jgi:hypothetical protein
MKLAMPKLPKIGGVWVIAATIILETADIGIKFIRERRLRREMQAEDELRESKNYILKKCLNILQNQQERRNNDESTE